MRWLLLFVLSLFVVQCVSVALGESLFRDFMTKYNKKYTGAEYHKRLAIFVGNLQIAEELNSKSTNAKFGVTKFMDLSKEEFRANYLNSKIPSKLPSGSVWKAPKKADPLPTEYDWNNSSTSCLTPVYNQEQCGSCWAFSATESIESQWALAGNQLTSLSMQQIVDCDPYDAGCNGGWPYNAYQYIINAGGIDTFASYPYTGENGQCQFSSSNIGATISSWQYVTQSEDENAMQSFTYSTGPPSICVDATIWQTYQGGVIDNSSGCGNSLDHCVQLTGWFQMNGMTVWNVRNSWGADWGYDGYVWVQMGYDVCGIAQVVTSAIV